MAKNDEFMTRLRNANVARQQEWDPSGFSSSLDWRTTELLGEVGEFANVVKKLYREECGVPGSRADREDLFREGADVVICLDLFAMERGFGVVPWEMFEPHSDIPIIERGRHIIRSLAGAISRIHEDSQWEMSASGLIYHVQLVVRKYGGDLERAIVDKFNATSVKMNLKTRL